jgi:hypothetical protein
MGHQLLAMLAVESSVQLVAAATHSNLSWPYCLMHQPAAAAAAASALTCKQRGEDDDCVVEERCYGNELD